MEEGGLRLRPLCISDSAFLKYGFKEGEYPGVSASGAAILRWIKKTYDLFWCIEIDLVPAGFAAVRRLRPGISAEAGLIVFDSALRRRGYGGRAFRLISNTLAVRVGVKKLNVRVLKDNQPALLFWKKMGFKSVCCEEGVCSMELDLARGAPPPLKIPMP
jgi:RimJ/RimL family protein N-acetyltransferase